MKIVNSPKLLVKEQSFSSKNMWRLSKYCIVENIANNKYIYNSLVGSIVMVTEDEYENLLKPTSQNFFVKYWFIVPTDFNEYELALEVRRKTTRTKPNTYKNVNGFVILPTSACNARCWYCFQNGQKRSHMSEQTAKDVVEFISRKATSKVVSIKWFGGEPMFNENVIDIIVMGLLNKGITVKSTMISNGFLFDPIKINKYKNIWNLSKVQITLDGTWENYNNIKQFSGPVKNPFEVVTSNITMLADNGIRVSVRINYSTENESDVHDVMKYYNEHWKAHKNISCYIAAVYQERSSPETSKQILDLGINVYNKMYPNNFGFITETSINPTLKNSHCMADGGGMVVIYPDGRLGGCEHYIDSHTFGTIYDDSNYDQDMIISYIERVDETHLCKDCPLFPGCHMIKICSDNYCDQYVRKYHELGARKSVRKRVMKYLRDEQNNSKKS